jgi:hypothetical protein
MIDRFQQFDLARSSVNQILFLIEQRVFPDSVPKRNILTESLFGNSSEILVCNPADKPLQGNNRMGIAAGFDPFEKAGVFRTMNVDQVWLNLLSKPFPILFPVGE